LAKKSVEFERTCAISSNRRLPGDENRGDDLIAAQEETLARLLIEREALAI
jgi:hypothetical protein